MKRLLVFRSRAFLAEHDGGDPEPAGKSLADYLARRLPERGFVPRRVVMEDWGWTILLNDGRVDCGFSAESDDGLYCRLVVRNSFMRRLLGHPSRGELMKTLASVVYEILEDTNLVQDLQWSTTDRG